MLDRMNFLRAWSIDGRRIRRDSWRLCVRRHRQNFTAAPVSHGWCRHADAELREFSLTIEPLRRKLRQPASSAVMISLMRSARGKIHGITRAVHNSEKRTGYNLAHRAVSGFSCDFRVGAWLASNRTWLVRVASKKKKASFDFFLGPHLSEV